jgi:hypothetical protein
VQKHRQEIIEDLSAMVKEHLVMFYKSTGAALPYTLLRYTSVPDRVVDPYSFFTDPDPDPELDGGGQYGSGSNTDPGL